MSEVVSFAKAQEIVATACADCAPASRKSVPLEQAAGRVLAEAISADRDMPAFSRSTRDGFAVRATSFLNEGARIAGTLPAGKQWLGTPLHDGECLEIMTGAPLPASADAVVMVEHVARSGDFVQLAAGRAIAAGDNVVQRGAEALSGAVLAEPGVRFGPAQVMLAAACGRASVEVFEPPRVSVLSTGDELVGLSEKPEYFQVRNSNAYALAAAARLAGADARIVGIARDNEPSLQEKIAAALPCDLLLLSGGVSAGRFDLVEPVLEKSFAAEFQFTGVKMQPGRPAAFGRLGEAHGGAWVFALPGNPVSAMVTFAVLARPLLLALAGERDARPPWQMARLRSDLAMPPGLTRFLPAHVEWESEGPMVERVTWQGSGDVAAAARGNAYVVVPETGTLHAGEWVRVLPAD